MRTLQFFLLATASAMLGPWTSPSAAQFDFSRVINRARDAVQSGTRNSPRRRPAIVRQLERAAMRELERAAPQVGRIIREATGGGHRILPVPPIETFPVRPRPVAPPVTGGPGAEKEEEIDLDQLPEVFAGEQVALESKGLSSQAKVLVKFTGLTLKARIVELGKTQTVVALPALGLEKPALAFVQVVKADGTVAQSLPVKYSPAREVAAKPETEEGTVRTEDLPEVSAGEEVLLDGEDLGAKPGSVTLSVGPLTLKATILEWKNETVSVRMPAMDLDEAAKAEVRVIRADGKVATAIDVRFSPSKKDAAKQ